jgi:hypothetical protein
MNDQPKHLKLKITPSNVIATVALFFALGGAGAVAATHLGKASVGTAQLKPGAVTGAKVKDQSLTGADLNVSTLGQVPSAAHANSAASADRAGEARRAENASHADSAAHADTAGHAETAGRADTAAHADMATSAEEAVGAETAKLAETASTVAEPEPVRFLGTPGQPPISATFTVMVNVGFYRDREGIVHLQGRLSPNTEVAGYLAELPPGYRPDPQAEIFYGIGPSPASHLVMEPGGSIYVTAQKGETVTLDGISWRAVA